MLNWANEFLDRCLSGIPESRYARRMREELEGHLEALAADLTAAGYAPEEARAEAVRRMGDPNRLKGEYLAAWRNSLSGQWEYRLKTWAWNFFVVMFGAQLFVMLGVGWTCAIASWFPGSDQNPLVRLMEETMPFWYTLSLSAALLAGARYLSVKFRFTRHPARRVVAGLTLYWASNAALLLWLEADSHQRTFWEQVRLWSSYPGTAVSFSVTFALCLLLGAAFGHLSAAKTVAKGRKPC